MTEQWRPIEGYERLYEVSNLGRVKSLEGITSDGRLKKEMILKPKMAGRGYLQVQLHKEGKIKGFYVHRLVAQAFIPNPEGLPQINHKDEDKTNNRVDNLEWCDRKYNMNYGTCKERIVQTRISNGNADPELCGVIKNEGMNEYKRQWWQKNQEKIREYQREYKREQYQNNREQILEQKRENYQKNREKILERKREQYQKNRDQINERRREQYRRRKEKTKQTT